METHASFCPFQTGDSPVWVPKSRLDRVELSVRTTKSLSHYTVKAEYAPKEEGTGVEMFDVLPHGEEVREEPLAGKNQMFFYGEDGRLNVLNRFHPLQVWALRDNSTADRQEVEHQPELDGMERCVVMRCVSACLWRVCMPATCPASECPWGSARFMSRRRQRTPSRLRTCAAADSGLSHVPFLRVPVRMRVRRFKLNGGNTIHLPETNELLGVIHLHHANAFAKASFGNSYYTHAFFTMSDKPPYRVLRVSNEWCIGSATRPAACDSIQFVMNMESDGEMLILPYGRNDVEAMVLTMPLEQAKEMLLPIERLTSTD